jgi:hypothetical protein
MSLALSRPSSTTATATAAATTTTGAATVTTPTATKAPPTHLATPTATNTRPTHPTVPSFPIPASARLHPSTTTTAPTATAATPTTATPTATGATPAPPGAGAAPGGRTFNSTTTVIARPHTRAHASPSGTLSTEAVVLAVIAALLLLACAAWAFARSRAYEPHWLLSLRHAMAEAGYRTSATWAEFSDWSRLGR